MPLFSSKSITPLLADLRQAAIERMKFFTAELEEMGLSTKFGMEVEGFVRNERGKFQKNLINTTSLTNTIQKAVPTFDRLHPEIGGIQIEAKTIPTTPLKAAETIAALKDGMIENAERWNIKPSFAAREKVGRAFENSGFHNNLSVNTLEGSPLFYQQGKRTTALQRHIIDGLTDMHAVAPNIYLPTEASYDRIRSTMHHNPLNPQSVRDLLTGVPNTAGHMYNKGMTFGNIASTGLGAIIGKGRTRSITTHYSDLEAKLMGVGEQLVFGGERTSWVGWAKPEHYRIESRLAGADADPYVVAAAELGAIYDAARSKIRKLVSGETVNEALEEAVDIGDRYIAIRKHPNKFRSYPLAKNANEGLERFSSAVNTRELLGEDFYHRLMVSSDFKGKNISSKLAEQLRESESYVAKQKPVGEHTTTEITQDMKQTLQDMSSPVNQANTSWIERVNGRGRGRELS